jgi:hypothetical protein
MKSRFLLITLCFLLAEVSFGQIPLYGFERQASLVGFTLDSAKVIGYGPNWTQQDGKRILGRSIIIWNAQNGEAIKTIDATQLRRVEIDGKTYTGMLGNAALHPNGHLMAIIGQTYYPTDKSGGAVETVLHFYDIEKDEFKSILLDKTNKHQRMVFHPTKNEAAFITLNEQANMVVIVVDLDKYEIKHTLMVGKGATMPLFVGYNTDRKHIYVGYGNSPMNGGVEIYNEDNGKLIKRVALRDQPEYFFEWNNQLMVSGHSSTIAIDLNTWAIRKTDKHLISDIHKQSGLAALNPLNEADMKRLNLLQISSNKRLNRDGLAVTRPIFSADGKTILAIQSKSEFDPKEASLEVPSAYLIRVE